MKESKFQKQSIKTLREYGFFVDVRFGSATTTKGLPDLLVVNKMGTQFNLELKTGSKLTTIQQLRLKQLPNGVLIDSEVALLGFIEDNSMRLPHSPKLGTVSNWTAKSESAITKATVKHLSTFWHTERRGNINLKETKGKADYIIAAGDKHFEIEFKTAKGLIREDQTKYKETSKYHVFIIRSSEDMNRMIKTINKEIENDRNKQK